MRKSKNLKVISIIISDEAIMTYGCKYFLHISFKDVAGETYCRNELSTTIAHIITVLNTKGVIEYLKQGGEIQVSESLIEDVKNVKMLEDYHAQIRASSKVRW